MKARRPCWRTAYFCSILALTALLFQPTAGSVTASPAIYDSKRFSDLCECVEKIGKQEAVVNVTGRSSVPRDLSVPANITLRFEQDGVLIVGKGATVTVASPVQAPVRRIFEGSGGVVLSRQEVYPQWWGARGDGSNDDGYAIQAAIDSVHAGGGGTVRLPAGTYLLNHITGAYYALRSRDRVSVIGEGDGSILRVGDNLRTATRGVAVLYNHEEPVSQCRYADFAVDYNGKNNLRHASWGADARVSNVSRMGAEHASQMVLERISFKDVTGAHCMYIGNQPGNRQNTIRDCTVSNVGQSVPGNGLGDHSSIYIGGSQGVVTGNVFRNQTPCNISTAIEIHSSDTVVSNNSVTNYATAVNIGGEANDCSRVVFENNMFKNCRNGVVFWHYASFVLRDVTIRGNTISLRETDGTPYPPSMGIIYGSGYVTAKTNMSALTIEGNTIRQETATAPNFNPNTAIHLWGVDNVVIRKNTISTMNGEAVYAEARSASRGMTGIVVAGNTIRNVGLTSTPGRKRAMAFNAYPDPRGSINDVHVRDNSIINSEGAPMLHAVTFNEGKFPHVEISGNTIQGASSSEIVRRAVGEGEVFQVDHAGKGSPADDLAATVGSRWIDTTTGRVYTYTVGQASGPAASGGWQAVD